jgi:hypothetical protein
MKCTNGGTRYQDCEKWRNKWAHEQAVFSDYLRYDYNPDGDNIRVSTIPCPLISRFRCVSVLLIQMCRNSNAARQMVSPATCGTILSNAMGNLYVIIRLLKV